jgi:hypothetical protein
MIARTAPAAAPARAFIAVSFTRFVAREIRRVPFVALRLVVFAFGFPAVVRFLFARITSPVCAPLGWRAIG